MATATDLRQPEIAVPGYQARRDYGPEDKAPVVLDGSEIGRIAVRWILPPPEE